MNNAKAKTNRGRELLPLPRHPQCAKQDAHVLLRLPRGLLNLLDDHAVRSGVSRNLTLVGILAEALRAAGYDLDEAIGLAPTLPGSGGERP